MDMPHCLYDIAGEIVTYVVGAKYPISATLHSAKLVVTGNTRACLWKTGLRCF